MLERITPADGQVSVWDFPRPPVAKEFSKLLKVIVNGVIIAETTNGIQVLEKYLAPSYYFPREDVKTDLLVPSDHATFCRHTGTASYYDIRVGDHIIKNACWSYEDPTEAYLNMSNYIAFFPARVDACYVDGVLATSQQADYYGGWITPDIVGPFAGDEGMGF